MTQKLAMDAWRLLGAGEFEKSWAIFDEIIEEGAPDARSLNNALYSVCNDNTGLGVQPERARRYLAAAEPFGTSNPPIFYTGACVLFELGDRKDAYRWISRALEGGYDDARGILEDAVFADAVDDPEFVALFADYLEGSILDTPDGLAILGFLRSLVGDHVIVDEVTSALEAPPRTAEQIGFYPGSSDTAAERCFRFMVSRLDHHGLLYSTEPHYPLELFEGIEDDIELPPSVRQLFSFWFSEEDGLQEDSGAGLDGFDQVLEEQWEPMARDIERAFEADGKLLRTLWTGSGDTLFFVAVDEPTENAWGGKTVVSTHDDEALGLRPPAWDIIYDQLLYQLGIED